MYANPAKGGQSGIHVAKVFAELGLDKQLGPKSSCVIAGRTV